MIIDFFQGLSKPWCFWEELSPSASLFLDWEYMILSCAMGLGINKPFRPITYSQDSLRLIKNGHCNIMQRRLSFLSWNGEITLNFPSFIKCFTEIIKGEQLFPKKIILWNFYFSKNPYLLLFQGITLFITYAHTHTHIPPAWIRYSIDMFCKEGRLS